jgi:hypothetical protein
MSLIGPIVDRCRLPTASIPSMPVVSHPLRCWASWKTGQRQQDRSQMLDVGGKGLFGDRLQSIDEGLDKSLTRP